MTREEFISLLDKYVKHQCSEEERQYFDNFFNSFQGDDAFRKQWNLTEKEHIMMEMYTSLNRTLDAEENERKMGKRRFYSTLIRNAAAMLILAVSGWIAYSSLNYRQTPPWHTDATPRGKRMTITLSDGSVVKLNAESSVSYPETFTGNMREVKLTGEAFFEVQKDPQHPFVVKTRGLHTTVLGTAFNVRAHDDENDIEITVKTGKVQVADSMNRVLLEPGEQARYHLVDRQLEKNDVSLERYLAWTNDIIYLDNTPVHEVVTVLERWYDIKISLQDERLGNCMLSGKYKSDRMKNVMDGLKFVQGIDYYFINDREIVLTGKPCNPNTMPMK